MPQLSAGKADAVHWLELRAASLEILVGTGSHTSQVADRPMLAACVAGQSRVPARVNVACDDMVADGKSRLGPAPSRCALPEERGEEALDKLRILALGRGVSDSAHTATLDSELRSVTTPFRRAGVPP